MSSFCMAHVNSIPGLVIKRKSKRKNSSNVEKIESKPQDKKEQ